MLQLCWGRQAIIGLADLLLYSQTAIQYIYTIYESLSQSKISLVRPILNQGTAIAIRSCIIIHIWYPAINNIKNPLTINTKFYLLFSTSFATLQSIIICRTFRPSTQLWYTIRSACSYLLLPYHDLPWRSMSINKHDDDDNMICKVRYVLQSYCSCSW